VTSDWLCLLQDLGTWFAPLRSLGRKQLPPGPGPDALRAKSDALVAALHPRSMRLRLEEVIEETPSTRTLRFVRVDGALPPFRPGQYVSLTVRIGETTTSRPYSVSSPPGVGHLDLTIKGEPGGFVSPWLLEQDVGWEVTSSGPLGSFVVDPLRDRGPVVLLAGGSGVTPFMSFVRDFAATAFPAPTTLLHNSRTRDELIFGAEAEVLAAHEAFTYVPVLSRPPDGDAGPTGHLDAARIREHVPTLDGASFFVCGPHGFIEFVVGELRSLGVPNHAIRRESFGTPSDVTEVSGWPAEVAGDAEFAVEVVGRGVVPATAGEPLLTAMERAGHVVKASCRTGECADCRMKVVAGEAFSLPDAGVREADRAQGFVHACVAYATSDLTVDPGR